MNSEKLNRCKNSQKQNINYRNVPHYFTLKVLLKLGGWVKWAEVKRNTFLKEQLSSQILIGSDSKIDEHGRLSRRKLSSLLQVQQNIQINPDSMVEKNLMQLEKDYRLNLLGIEIIRLLYYSQSNQTLLESMKLIAKDGYPDEIIVSKLLNVTVDDIRKVISKNPAVIKYKLFEHPESGEMVEHYLLESNVYQKLAEGKVVRNPVEWLNHSVKLHQPEALENSMLINLEQDVLLASSYLEQAFQQKTTEVNILLTGKNQYDCKRLAETIIANAGGQVIEVVRQWSDADGPVDPMCDEIGMDERINHVLQSQHLYKETENTAILFEDAYDYFSEMDKFGVNIEDNQVLGNTVPVFWAMESSRFLSDSLIHQFDLVLEVRLSHHHARRNLIDQNFSEFNLDEQWLKKLSDNDRLTPDIVKNLKKVVSTMQIRNPAEIQQHMDRMVSNVLAQNRRHNLGQRRSRTKLLPGTCSTNPVENYDLSLINADIDMQVLAQGLGRTSEGRIILSGPAGTGKTAFSHYLAHACEKELIVKPASSLLAKYVGETEQNIADAFAEAVQRNAVLLIDEADSFLSNRESARQRWESGMTNEFLIQMEDFRGIMIACTNLKSNLDSAVQRRFDFKVELDFMTAGQIQKMFFLLLEYSEIETKKMFEQIANNQFYQRISGLINITPGDFKTVLRRHKILDTAVTVDSLVVGLNEEAKEKTVFSQQSKAIGFTAAV